MGRNFAPLVPILLLRQSIAVECSEMRTCSKVVCVVAAVDAVGVAFWNAIETMERGDDA